MNLSGVQKRLVGQVPKTSGTLTDRGGRKVPVKFSLTQWSFDMDGIPATRRADGELEFLNLADAFDLRDIDAGVTLEGGGIQAEVEMHSLRAFTVVGGYVNDISTPEYGAVGRYSEPVHQ